MVRRGYARAQVDTFLAALARGDLPAQGEAQGQPPAFDVAWRGYDRQQVDARIAELLQGPDGLG
ncbi:hypothetical protein ABH940_001387 [Streptacidiphilus sp. BW17]|uniref:hypothetical protein n=1 Tax=Streptacidiphilus sp. BW17 TaxID=3156274 RepID=UPI003514D1BF